MKTLFNEQHPITNFYHLPGTNYFLSMKNMDGYIYRINENNSFILDKDEIKDVKQDITVYLSQKQYNDRITKKTILKYYTRAVNRKLHNQEIRDSGVYMELSESDAQERETERLQSISKLKLTDKEKKIVELLVRGFTYDEIKKKLRLSAKQLYNYVSQIKIKNTKE